jgi:hypothetical protein
MEKLRQTDQKYHGRDGYLVSELIRQVTQIRFGELISEEAKGKAWDKHRVFFVSEYGTTENLMKSMAATLKQAVPRGLYDGCMMALQVDDGLSIEFR